ncbi:MAG: hypothetical protein JHC39_05305 [Lentimicrobium sp.]|jgi:hypothetical protein|nr:hypothetical protein [Lentimicrobium sp.]
MIDRNSSKDVIIGKLVGLNQKINILKRDLTLTEYPLKSKIEVAQDIINTIVEMYNPVEETVF